MNHVKLIMQLSWPELILLNDDKSYAQYYKLFKHRMSGRDIFVLNLEQCV